MAQWLERPAVNRNVVGSNPTWGDANIGVGITTCLYRKLLGLPLKFNTVSTVLRKFDVLIKSEPVVVHE